MNKDTLHEAIIEAERFINTAKRVEFVESSWRKGTFFPTSNVHSAAAKRASMDLTRALSRMRKPS